MNSMNIIGRLTKDPELRRTEDGKSICNFSLAVDDTRSKEARADFIRCTVFGIQGENCEKYLKKGFLAGVSGRFRSDIYKDAEGITRYPISLTAERVQFLQWPDRTDTKNEVESDAVVTTQESSTDNIEEASSENTVINCEEVSLERTLDISEESIIEQ